MIRIMRRAFIVSLVMPAPESRYLRVNGTPPILQSLSQVVVVKFLAESSKWRRLWMRALTCRAHGMTPCAQCFKEDPASLLFLIEGITGLAPRAHHQKREAKFVHRPRPCVAMPIWFSLCAAKAQGALRQVN